MDNSHAVIVNVIISAVVWVRRRNEGKFNGLDEMKENLVV